MAFFVMNKEFDRVPSFRDDEEPSESLAPNRLSPEERGARVDAIEQEMAKHPQVHCPVKHIFTKGLYTRIITLPAGTLLTSEIHKTEHPFFIMSGVVEVAYVDSGETVMYEGPCLGVTKPNTRRVLNVLEETVWATCHVTNETDPEKIGEKILVQDRPIKGQYKIDGMKGETIDEHKMIEV